jgi:hypothetical protein
MTIPATFFYPVSQCSAGSSKKPTWSFWKMSVLVIFFLVACSALPDASTFDFSNFAKEYVANISVLSGMFAQAQFLKSSQRVFLFQKDFVEDGKKKKRLADMFLFDRLILHLQASADPWHNRIAEILVTPKTRKDICVTFAVNGSNVMAHIVMHNDKKMIALANDEKLRKFPFSFPRGFGILFNKDRITGVAPFYPKFDNDREKTSEEVIRGKYNSASIFLKYSGSNAKVLIWKDETDWICWAVMSKNSADSTSSSGDSGINYPRELAKVIAPYMTQERLQAIHASGVRSFCAEVMLECDQSHGYAVKDGFIVTCAATETEFLDSQKLTKWCEAIGLPTDRPLHIEGTDKILAFVQALNEVRDVMTLDVFQSILKKYDLEYNLSKHRDIVQSDIFEGIIFTLRNAEGEKLVLKYKFAYYTAVTMFLREYMKTTRKGESFDVKAKLPEFLKNWVFDKSVEMQSLWRWILNEMVSVADTETFEGPVASWIQASERVYARVFAALAANGNDAAKVCELLGCPMLEQQQRSLIEVTIALVLGPIGYGKSTFASYLAALIPNSVHIDGDGNEAWLPKDLVLALKGERNAETVAAILAAIQAGKNVVFSTGGGAIWSFPNCGQKAMNSQTISFLETKAKEMGIKLKFVVYVPDNMEAEYADEKAVKYAIEGRKVRREKWEKPIDFFIKASAANIEFAKNFMKQAVKVHTYPRFIFDDVTNESALRAIFQSGTDLMSSNPQTPLELSCLRQQQLVSIENISPPTISAELRNKYADPSKKGRLLFTFQKLDESTFHITLSYDAGKTPKPLAAPFFPVGSTQTVPLHHCVAKLSDGTLAPFIFIDLGRDGMHVTVHPGRFKPESMRAVALAMQAGQSSAVFVPQQGEPETLTFEVVSTQQVQINAYNVVSHA